MAWIISATSRGFVANRHLRSLQVVLLAAHLAMLIALLINRPTADAAAGRSQHANASLAPDLADVSAGPATLALVTGLLLALLMLAGGRGRNATPTIGTRDTQPLTSMAVPAAIGSHEGLLARLNHDLRTPLNALIGFADLMKSETFGPLGNDKYRAYADHMHTCGHDLLRATENTLAMATLLTAPADRGSECIELTSLVESAWAEFGAGRDGGEPRPPLRIATDQEIHIRSNLPAVRQSFIHLLTLACDRAGPDAIVAFSVARSHGRVDACIVVDGCRAIVAPRTGCRPPHSAETAVDELSLGVARALLELHGVPLVERSDAAGAWSVTMTFEDAVQADFFQPTVRKPSAQGLVQRATHAM